MTDDKWIKHFGMWKKYKDRFGRDPPHSYKIKKMTQQIETKKTMFKQFDWDFGVTINDY